MSAVSGAVETAPVLSAHGFGSANPDDFPVPAGREEEWRFTPLRRLRALHKDAPLAQAGVTVSVDAAPEVVVDLARDRAARPAGGFLPADRVSARAYQAATTATVITVPREAVASQPTYVRVTGTGDGASAPAAAGHLVIDVAPFGRATVVIDQRGSATYADNVEIAVGDGGDLEVVTIADWAADAVQVSAHHATLGRDAHLRHVVVMLGGSLVRLSPTVRYTGPGGDAELYGLCFADGGQHLEQRLFVDHDVPNCRSLVRYKSALSGDDAHAVWIGDVLIRPEATGTDTYEYNRNLVLTDGARADSVPNLEILTGEVAGAGHASANGRLEDEHLFYLMSRGIPEAEARRLVIRGFFGELIERISVPEVRERVTALIEGELA
ncbi:MAG TPA: Fe-S cluster assembly protein SufD [Trebonia sp.]|jgi:Fe-S cluster assembly protein SufD|nr:Fe-S cluster assembly protein SufD [Trebonia sp.]